MKTLVTSAVSLLVGSVIGCYIGYSYCTTVPVDNFPQEMGSILAETTVTMAAMKSLDSGDVAKARRVAMIPVLDGFDFWRFCIIEGMFSPTPKQKEEWTKLAKETLNYTLRLRDIWSSTPVLLRDGMRGLRFILTEPEDVHRLNELSDYLARTEQKNPAPQKP